MGSELCKFLFKWKTITVSNRVFGTYLLQFHSSLQLNSYNIWYQSEKRKSGFSLKNWILKVWVCSSSDVKTSGYKKMSSLLLKYAQRQLQLISSPKINVFSRKALNTSSITTASGWNNLKNCKLRFTLTLPIYFLFPSRLVMTEPNNSVFLRERTKKMF